MAIPKYNEIYREVLQAVSDGLEHTISDICEYIAKAKNLTPEELNQFYANGINNIFKTRVRWARTYLKAAGLLICRERGLTCISEQGKRILESGETIDNNYLKQFPSFLEFISPEKMNANVPNIPDDTTPQESIEVVLSRINSNLSEELLEEIMKHKPAFFEKLVVDLLVKMGYGDGTTTRLSHDNGIDGIIHEDKLGFSNIFIQAKRFDANNSTVGQPEIQKFIGAIANKHGKGLFITTTKFSENAETCAKENHIVLIDGKKLAELMIEYKLGVSVEQTFEIKKIDSDYFSEE